MPVCHRMRVQGLEVGEQGRKEGLSLIYVLPSPWLLTDSAVSIFLLPAWTTHELSKGAAGQKGAAQTQRVGHCRWLRCGCAQCSKDLPLVSQPKSITACVPNLSPFLPWPPHHLL